LPFFFWISQKIYRSNFIKYFINEDTANKIREEITSHDGGEIFFGCYIDEENNITDVDPICYGNDDEVLAPYDLVKNFNAILHNHPSGNTKPSQADFNYANFLQNEGIGFFITDNDASKLTTVIPPIKIKSKDLLDIDFIRHLFDDDGYIKKNKPDYEVRDGQIEMAIKIAESFNNKTYAVLEAGTGIGKSLAYLIPAFLWAEKNNERVIISTNTINLQAQLMNKDIPLVKQILNSPLEAVLVKGRRNYLCKLKLGNLQNELDFDDSIEEMNSIISWAGITEEGNIDELNFIPANSNWEKVASDSDFCLANNCLYYQDCFLQMARRHATESNILITNHHILFADIQIRSNGRGFEENILLPPYKSIIFDEAHNIEKSASSFFSLSFSKHGFYKFLGNYRAKNNKGFLPRLSTKFAKQNMEELTEIAGFIDDDILGSFGLLYNGSFNIFSEMNGYIEKIKERVKDAYGNSISYRITTGEWESDDFNEEFITHLKDLSGLVKDFAVEFNRLITKIDLLPERLKFDVDFKIAKSYKNKLEVFDENLSKLLNIDSRQYVPWIEIFGSGEDPLFTLTASPLYVNRILYESIYSVYETVIFTSATLTVDKTFNYFNDLSGLSFKKNDGNTFFDSIESPFDYKKRVLVVVPSDMPEPNSAMYNDRINEFIKETVLETKGSSFVLFTSYNQLKKSYNEVNPVLRENGYRSYYQGEMEKNKLLESFQNDIESNLFATDSFWEGVDAPGETLRYVILAKLPFRMPTEPVENAKIEDMEKRGLNPFMDYTLPSAVIRFKQGFGRLVRKKDDYGIVALLDSRALSKPYGKIFFKSLPQCKFFSGTNKEILKEIKKHIEECKL
jgi:ATP-dependent DNA helicase DinG